MLATPSERRLRMVKASENFEQAKFAEFLFHALLG
jgi:hypothetical protein